MKKIDLINICRVFHYIAADYIFFLSSPWNVLQIDHILGHKARLSKYKKIETICILSDHSALKLELNNKNNSRRHANIWRMDNTLLNDQGVIAEIRVEIKRFLEASENQNTTHQNLWDTAKAVLRGNICTYKCIY
jgi:hypothetical protein